MKRSINRLVSLTAIAVCASIASAQPYDIDWNTIDTGGGPMVGAGNLELNGTIGQHDAGVPLTGGGFELVGGFWSAAILAPACDSLDFNQDGLFPDSQDLDDFIAVLGGGPAACSNFPSCADIDFNNDGLFPDSTDLDLFIVRLAGGPCV
jgi:hypothetical protein